MRTLAEIEEALAAVGTAERAAGSKRYLKSEMRHLGARVPQIRAEARGAAREVESRASLLRLAQGLWDEPTFELRACAAFLLDYRVDLLRPADLATVKRYIATAGTWALVDPLSAELIGDLLLRHPEAATRLDPWAWDRDFWIRRAALLSQIKPLKAGAPFDRFAGWADAMLGEREFFIRKAIGWVLREASKTREGEVYGWLLPRADRASGVTVREAVKYLGPDHRETILAARG